MNKKILTLPLVMAPLLASCGSNSSIIMANKMVDIRVQFEKETIISLPFCVTKKAFSVKAGEQKTFKIRYTQTFPIMPGGTAIPQVIQFSPEPLDPNKIYQIEDVFLSIDSVSEINKCEINKLVISKTSSTDYVDWFLKVFDYKEEINSYIIENEEIFQMICIAFEGKEGDSINETITITFKKDFENIYMNVGQYLIK